MNNFVIHGDSKKNKKKNNNKQKKPSEERAPTAGLRESPIYSQENEHGPIETVAFPLEPIFHYQFCHPREVGGCWGWVGEQRKSLTLRSRRVQKSGGPHLLKWGTNWLWERTEPGSWVTGDSVNLHISIACPSHTSVEPPKIQPENNTTNSSTPFMKKPLKACVHAQTLGFVYIPPVLEQY